MPALSVARLPGVMRQAKPLAIRSVKIFAESTQRDAVGEFSVVPDALMASALRAAKDAQADIAVMTETCLCSHTDTGFCYVTDRHGRPDINATIDVTSRQALTHAAAGADIVGPASMGVGTTKGAREALNAAGTRACGLRP